MMKHRFSFAIVTVLFLVNLTFWQYYSSQYQVKIEMSAKDACTVHGDQFVVINHISQLPSQEDIQTGRICHPNKPRIMYPYTMTIESTQKTIIFDAFFRTPLDLIFIGFYHPGEPNWRDVNVIVDGCNMTGKLTELGAQPNGRYITYHLLHPVSDMNTVEVRVMESYKKFINLPISSKMAVNPFTMHVTLFRFDEFLLHLNYHHYTRQGFTHFVWAFNGDVFKDNVSPFVPKQANILMVQWNVKFSDDGQQGLITLLTWIMIYALPHTDWLMYTDLDEHAYVTTGVPVMTRVEQLGVKQYYTFSNRFAHAMPNWREWIDRFNNGTIDGPYLLTPSKSLLQCPTRSKTLYHRSFPYIQQPEIGAHMPHNTAHMTCPQEFEHYHVLNYRKGITSGEEMISEFLPSVDLFYP